MRRRPLSFVVRAAVAGSVVAILGSTGAAGPFGLSRRGPLLDLTSTDTPASSPIDLQTLATGDLSGVPGPAFDPAKVDQLEAPPGGVSVAWTTNLSTGGLRNVIFFHPGKKRERLTHGGGEDDQPSIGYDTWGVRIACRGSSGARRTTQANIWLWSTPRPTPAGTGTTAKAATTADAALEKQNVTNLVATADPADATKIVGTAYDPALCARTRVREIAAGIKVKERDARIAFVSTGDLDKGRNRAARPQLFLWREQAADFVQLTSITGAGFQVNRPSITTSGQRIAFECSADLTPSAVDPKTPTRVGNPSGVRQIYLWDGPRGIRQLTWSNADCLAPRISGDGRFVQFCSRGDLLPGGNPEGNFEIFVWVQSGDRSREIRQLTRTALGDNVLPRPGWSPDAFAFWSTSTPAGEDAAFGSGTASRLPLAYVHRRGKVVHVGGWTDAENGPRLLALVAGTPTGTVEFPIVTGPPCITGDPGMAQFVTNDISLNATKADDDLDGQNGGNASGAPHHSERLPDDRALDASYLTYHVARTAHRAASRSRR